MRAAASAIHRVGILHGAASGCALRRRLYSTQQPGCKHARVTGATIQACIPPFHPCQLHSYVSHRAATLLQAPATSCRCLSTMAISRKRIPCGCDTTARVIFRAAARCFSSQANAALAFLLSHIVTCSALCPSQTYPPHPSPPSASLPPAPVVRLSTSSSSTATARSSLPRGSESALMQFDWLHIFENVTFQTASRSVTTRDVACCCSRCRLNPTM
jgi:hypothetical protein